MSERTLVLEGPQSTRIRDNAGREYVNFASNDYLQLANHPGLVEAGIACLRDSGAGMASVAFISGFHRTHELLEDVTTEWLGAEACLLFSSCYAANVGLFGARYGDGDLIISDALNHASLIDGIRLTKAKRSIYPHGDLARLEEILQDRGSFNRCAIVADTVFSMEGEYADVEELRRIAAQYSCDLILDHSHLTGTEPPDGIGAYRWSPLPESEFIITGTYGKALGGSAGGFIAGSAAVIADLRKNARPYIFSNLMPPVAAAIATEAIRVVQREPERGEQLQRNITAFSRIAGEFDVPLNSGHQHPIIPLRTVDDGAVARASELLSERMIHAVALSYPVVPQGEGRIRVQLTSGHTEQEMRDLLEVWAESIH